MILSFVPKQCLDQKRFLNDYDIFSDLSVNLDKIPTLCNTFIDFKLGLKSVLPQQKLIDHLGDYTLDLGLLSVFLRQGKQVRTNQEGGSLHDNEPDEMASLGRFFLTRPLTHKMICETILFSDFFRTDSLCLNIGQTNLSSKPLEESGYDATQTISAINQDETSDPTIFPAGTTSEQGDMGDPMVQTLLGMVPKVHELTWTNCGHFTRSRSHEEGISRARSSLERANLKDSRYFMFFDPFIHKGPFDGSLSFSLVSTDANPSIISSRSCYWARPLRKAKGGLLDDWACFWLFLGLNEVYKVSKFCEETIKVSFKLFSTK